MGYLERGYACLGVLPLVCVAFYLGSREEKREKKEAKGKVYEAMFRAELLDAGITQLRYISVGI